MPDTLTGPDHRTLLHLFQHPLTHNLSLREVTGLFDSIGSVETQHNGDIHFRLNDDAMTMKRPHAKDLNPTEVMDLRHFLSSQGWSPDGAPNPASAVRATPTDLVVMIDHQGAHVHHLTGQGKPRYLLHEVKRSQHDADREETYPADTRFFEEVAQALAGAERIVLIGHGKGQSNEAGHLSDYLRQHHKDLHIRIAREIVADLPHLQLNQLLGLARDALAPDTNTATSTHKGA